MPRLGPAQWLVALTLPFLAGCAENPLILRGQLDKSQQQQQAAARQKDELQTRANSLDRDNQELLARLTQEQQRSKVLQDQAAVVRDQLAGTAAQLARLREEKKSNDQKVQALTASLQRQSGTTITPNNSLLQTLPAINLPDVYARRDGDVIRIELPAHRLFEPGNARLLPGSQQAITAVAAEILRTYPDQIIGVEGHTDSDPSTRRPMAEPAPPVARPGPGGLRRPDHPVADPIATGLRSGPRGEPPALLQRHDARQAAERPGGTGDLSRDGAKA